MDFGEADISARSATRTIPSDAIEGFWIAPDGQEIRRIDWAAADAHCRGSLLFLPGRADFYEKYLETLIAWHAQGWRVTALDWRGQGLSGRLGHDGVTGHVGDFGEWVDDLAAFWSAWCSATPSPHVVIAHSMGGHIALRALAERRIAPDAAVLVAPMLGFIPAWLPLRVLHAIARIAVNVIAPVRAAWRGAERPAALLGDRGKLLTHDRDRYDDETWWREFRPELAMAAPSWGWIERSIDSMRRLRRRGFLEAVSTPVLVLATRCDRLVAIGAIRRAVRRMANAELIEYGNEARHEILREADPVRDKALAAIAEFLDRTAPESD